MKIDWHKAVKIVVLPKFTIFHLKNRKLFYLKKVAVLVLWTWTQFQTTWPGGFQRRLKIFWVWYCGLCFGPNPGWIGTGFVKISKIHEAFAKAGSQPLVINPKKKTQPPVLKSTSLSSICQTSSKGWIFLQVTNLCLNDSNYIT